MKCSGLKDGIDAVYSLSPVKASSFDNFKVHSAKFSAGNNYNHAAKKPSTFAYSKTAFPWMKVS